jgi:conjugal transfer mating pair stabilization protein TraG
MSNWQNDISGNTFSSNMLTGRTAVSLLRNQGYASRVVSMRVSEQDVQDASRQVDAARSEAVAASTERSAVLSEAFTKGLAKLKSSRSSTGSTSSSFEQLGQTLNRLDQITRSVADSTGMSQSQVANIAFGAAAHLGLSTAVAGGKLNATADKSYLSGLTAQEQKVLGSMTSEQLSEFKQFGDRVSRDSSFSTAVAADAREATEIASRISSSATRTTRAEAALGGLRRDPGQWLDAGTGGCASLRQLTADHSSFQWVLRTQPFRRAASGLGSPPHVAEKHDQRRPGWCSPRRRPPA